MRDYCRQFTRRAVLAAGLAFTALACVVITGPAVHAADSDAAGFPMYKPPLRGTPAARVGGGTRGEGDDAPVVHVLAPEHTGLTANPRPVLYWYLSRPVQAGVEFVLIAEADYEPLVETALTGVTRAGIQRIALADFGVRLKPGVPYQWSVAVVMDEGQRSGDVLASGMIEYVEPQAEVLAGVDKAAGEARVARLAEAGLWYDALQTLDELIRSAPGDTRLLQVRASLLEQVGLGEVAAVVGG